MYGAKRQTTTSTETRKAREKTSAIGKRGHTTNHTLRQYMKIGWSNESRVNDATAKRQETQVDNCCASNIAACNQQQGSDRTQLPILLS